MQEQTVFRHVVYPEIIIENPNGIIEIFNEKKSVAVYGFFVLTVEQLVDATFNRILDHSGAHTFDLEELKKWCAIVKTENQTGEIKYGKKYYEYQTRSLS